MIRRYGEAVKAGQTYTRRPGVYAILIRGDSLLATVQMDPGPEFQLPGGGIDRGEHPIAALHREVMEETGWRIRLRRHLCTFRRFTYMPEYDLWAEKVCAVYLARPVRQLGPATEAGHVPIWLPLTDAARVLGNVGDQSVLRKVVSGGFGPV
jgi:8-oxo-dGTP diphosphatase